MENDRTAWQDDLLGRQQDAEFLFKFLMHRIDERESRGFTRSYVLNLDAAWGEGKSYFLEQFSKDLRSKSFLVAAVNAWHDDYADDPLLAVMSSIDEVINPLIQTRTQSAEKWKRLKHTAAAVSIAVAKGAALQIGRLAIGAGADAIAGAVGGGDLSTATDELQTNISRFLDQKAEEALSRFRDNKKTITRFKTDLEEFLSEIAQQDFSLPLFILIDELDRCRPTYAITLLERVKHLFNVNGVVFVIATDTLQLRHAIGAVYGIGFDAYGYLNRFFDRTYRFEPPPLEVFVEHLLASYLIDTEKFAVPNPYKVETILVSAFSYFEISLRDVEQCMDMLRSIVTVWRLSIKIELTVIIFMIIAHHKNKNLSMALDFITSIRELAPKSLSRKPWDYTIGSVTSGGTYKQEKISALGLLEKFIIEITKPLSENVNKIINDPSDNWVFQMLSQEFVALKRDGIRTESFPYSIISTYPILVRTVGRLTPEVSNQSE